MRSKSFEEFKAILQENETQTLTKYIVIKTSGNLKEKFVPKDGHRILWDDVGPYIVAGSMQLACHQGKDNNIYQKQKYAEQRERKAEIDHCLVNRYNLKQPTKKLDCPANFIVRRLFRILEVEVPAASKHGRTKQAAVVRSKILAGQEVSGEDVFLFEIPNIYEHRNHAIREAANVTQPLHVQNIKDLARNGERDARDISEVSKTMEQFTVLTENGLEFQVSVDNEVEIVAEQNGTDESAVKEANEVEEREVTHENEPEHGYCKRTKVRKLFDVEDNDPSEDYEPPKKKYAQKAVPEEDDCTGTYKSMNLTKLFLLSRNKESVHNYMKYCGTIPTEKRCPRCNGTMKLYENRELWRCDTVVKVKGRKKTRCEKRLSMWHSTWFTRTALSFSELLQVSYMMVYNFSLDDIERETTITKTTLCYWRSFVRQVLTHFAIRCSTPVGGPEKTVELRETKFNKVRVSVGTNLQEQWILTGMERESGDVFVTAVSTKTSDTLAKVIKEWVKPKTTVVMAEWKSDVILEKKHYKRLSDLTFAETKNGPPSVKNSPAWSQVKKYIPHFNVNHRALPGYLSHYVFFKYCVANSLDPFETFLRETAKIDFDSQKRVLKSDECDELLNDT